MSNTNDGGAAFPFTKRYDDGRPYGDHGGMTLRDYFAAKAMQGYLASFDPHAEPVEFASSIAGDAYILADAMLKARK